MKSPARISLIMALGMALGVTLTIGTSVLADRQGGNGTGGTLPLEELRGLSEVFGRVKADYVEEVDDKSLLEGAIRGMLSSLDPHSAYLDKEEFKSLQEGTTGKFGGLGIEVTMEDGFVKVVTPIDDTPAMRAGVVAGDLIIRLDDTPVKGMTLSEAVKIMRGEPGTDITLTIVREGTQKPVIITVTRDIIKVDSVKSRMLDKGYGYLRITSFQSNTGEDVHRAISELKRESKNGLKGMVLDLRNNPGGVLGAAVTVSDAFLNKGKIVYTEGRAENAVLDFNATPGDALDSAPLVVLVNEGSASASEIVAGALQDHERAIIMGARTFGKGSVQTIFPVSNEAAVKITTARYYTPAGRSIQAEGIEPDIKVEPVKVSKQEDNGIQLIKEADLSRHLTNGNESKSENKKANKEGKEADESLIESDYVLYEALSLLKGLNILQKNNSGE